MCWVKIKNVGGTSSKELLSELKKRFAKTMSKHFWHIFEFCNVEMQIYWLMDPLDWDWNFSSRLNWEQFDSIWHKQKTKRKIYYDNIEMWSDNIHIYSDNLKIYSDNSDNIKIYSDDIPKEFHVWSSCSMVLVLGLKKRCGKDNPLIYYGN